MMGQAPWEKALRRRLRSKAKKVPSRIQLGATDMIAAVAIGAFLIAVFSLAAENDAERMVAVTLVTGIYGTLLGASLRARWQDGVWLAPYAPVDVSGMRKLETRGALPGLIRVGIVGLVMAALGCLPGWPNAPLKAMPVAGVSMLTGMVFSSGRWGKLMLWTSGIGSTVWSFVTMLRNDLGAGSVSYGYVNGWLPAFPWSLGFGDLSLVVPRLSVFAVALVVISFEWRKAWMGADHAVARDYPTKDNEEDHPSESEAQPHPMPEVVDSRPELRHGVRATVTHGWIGLAAYVHFDHIAWMDRWLWKSLVPRQRMLSCLGIYGTKLWLRQVKLACGLLAAAVALIWTMRYSMQGDLGPSMATYGILLGLPVVGLALIAFAVSFPGAKSTFEPWTSPFNPGLQRSVSPLAIFPISPDEWVRGAAREWQVRGCLVALIWSMATVAAVLAFAENASTRDIFGWVLAPWLLWASLLPFSVGGRLLRAHYGHAQGFVLGIRLLLSLGLMMMSPAAIIVGMIGFALQHFPTFAGGIAVAAISGRIGLRQAVASCGNMRTDIAFDVRGKPQS